MNKPNFPKSTFLINDIPQNEKQSDTKQPDITEMVKKCLQEFKDDVKKEIDVLRMEKKFNDILLKLLTLEQQIGLLTALNNSKSANAFPLSSLIKPQNPTHFPWHNPTQPPQMPTIKNWVSPEWYQHALRNRAPSETAIKLKDLPPHPYLAVKPEDLSLCNGVVACSIGAGGELYRLTTDNVIADTIPWGKLNNTINNIHLKIDWGNNGVWGIFTEAVPDILPKGTLIHQYSNVLIGVIVRYPTKKIRLQTS